MKVVNESTKDYIAPHCDMAIGEGKIYIIIRKDVRAFPSPTNVSKADENLTQVRLKGT